MDSVSSPLTSAFSASGGWRDESPHNLWLQAVRLPCVLPSSPLPSVLSAARGSPDKDARIGAVAKESSPPGVVHARQARAAPITAVTPVAVAAMP